MPRVDRGGFWRDLQGSAAILFIMKIFTKRGVPREPQMGEFEALDSSDRADRPAERRRAEALSPDSPIRNPAPTTRADEQPEMGWRHPRFLFSTTSAGRG